ncbi:pseudouridine synthase [Saccharicrinis carchari]|uniref:Pseudouridine synthase n=1 Tax=Saccharicrinis carchari TaxID=1168039 RepID=A0A521DBI2_SACCC|nr:pseudouridine synthase [Saccharicrinis carchari]SMO69124.1 pseudouridine synthase [Saccharicrinis carchari]
MRERRYKERDNKAKESKRTEGQAEASPSKAGPAKSNPKPALHTIRLNKFIANAGVCSRRDADKLIAEGLISVNGEVVTTVGTTVKTSDKVVYEGKELKAEKLVYVLLNKPKNFVTTLSDPHARHTVMDLVKHACAERIYPVGRLDKMTTGILLLTNDGDLAKRLTHPSHEHRKIYHAFLDKEITKEHLHSIATGLELEDGFIKADKISLVKGNAKEVGIEIHSGKNRIVRRIFQHLGYEVVMLDRVYFSGLTKKDVPRGKWRFLTPHEVTFLKAGIMK